MFATKYWNAFDYLVCYGLIFIVVFFYCLSGFVSFSLYNQLSDANVTIAQLQKQAPSSAVMADNETCHANLQKLMVDTEKLIKDAEELIKMTELSTQPMR